MRTVKAYIQNNPTLTGTGQTFTVDVPELDISYKGKYVIHPVCRLIAETLDCEDIELRVYRGEDPALRIGNVREAAKYSLTESPERGFRKQKYTEFNKF